MKLEVLFTPAEFAALNRRDLSKTTCVVFDILRATTSMTAALANGAAAIYPVLEIADAVALHKKMPDALLAGERNGLRITAAQTGSVDFDLGNSPREFTSERVRGKNIIMTTTNGTRALQACAGAQQILAASFLNLKATAALLTKTKPEHLLLVCAGTFEEAAYEDTLAAGALAESIGSLYESGDFTDSAHMARDIYRAWSGNLETAFHHSRNARKILSVPALLEDVAFCRQRDLFDFCAIVKDGQIIRHKV